MYTTKSPIVLLGSSWRSKANDASQKVDWSLLNAFQQAEKILYAALDTHIAAKARKGEFVNDGPLSAATPSDKLSNKSILVCSV